MIEGADDLTNRTVARHRVWAPGSLIGESLPPTEGKTLDNGTGVIPQNVDSGEFSGIWALDR